MTWHIWKCQIWAEYTVTLEVFSRAKGISIRTADSGQCQLLKHDQKLGRTRVSPMNIATSCINCRAALLLGDCSTYITHKRLTGTRLMHIKDQKPHAKCKFCKSVYIEADGTTTNFNKHILGFVYSIFMPTVILSCRFRLLLQLLPYVVTLGYCHYRGKLGIKIPPLLWYSHGLQNESNSEACNKNGIIPQLFIGRTITFRYSVLSFVLRKMNTILSLKSIRKPLNVY